MSMVVNTNVGWTLQFAGRTREAMDAYRAALALDPDYLQAHMRLATAYQQLGRTAEAVAEAEHVVKLSPDSVGRLAEIYALVGRRREAADLLNRLLDMRTRQYVAPYTLALVTAALGQHDAAFGWLERAYEERSNGLAYLAVSPEMIPVRGDLRYRNLLRRVGLDAAAASPTR